jgi:putative FmdB family regulatory protein
MPLFEYACQECAHEFEALVRGSESPECPACHATALQRRQSTFAAHTNGPSPFRRVESAVPSPCGSCGDPRGPGACSMN